MPRQWRRTIFQPFKSHVPQIIQRENSSDLKSTLYWPFWPYFQTIHSDNGTINTLWYLLQISLTWHNHPHHFLRFSPSLRKQHTTHPEALSSKTHSQSFFSKQSIVYSWPDSNHRTARGAYKTKSTCEIVSFVLSFIIKRQWRARGR